MTSSASHDVYDTLISLRDKLTRLNGVITPEAVDKLEDELGGIFTVAKTHHYDQGQKYGHLASAIPESKYRLVIGNATWTHTVPLDPGALVVTTLQGFFEAFAKDGIAKVPNEDVRAATEQIIAVAERLAEVSALPSESTRHILEGFTRCSVIVFRQTFAHLLVAERLQQLRYLTN